MLNTTSTQRTARTGSVFSHYRTFCPFICTHLTILPSPHQNLHPTPILPNQLTKQFNQPTNQWTNKQSTTVFSEHRVSHCAEHSESQADLIFVFIDVIFWQILTKCLCNAIFMDSMGLKNQHSLSLFLSTDVPSAKLPMSPFWLGWKERFNGKAYEFGYQKKCLDLHHPHTSFLLYCKFLEGRSWTYVFNIFPLTQHLGHGGYLPNVCSKNYGREVNGLLLRTTISTITFCPWYLASWILMGQNGWLQPLLWPPKPELRASDVFVQILCAAIQLLQGEGLSHTEATLCYSQLSSFSVTNLEFH